MISIRSFKHLIETARQRRKEKRENLGDTVNKQNLKYGHRVVYKMNKE